MKISLAAEDYIANGPVPFVSFERMGEIARENRLYSDRSLSVSGKSFRELATVDSLQKAEEQVNSLLISVRRAPRQESRQSLREALTIVKNTESPHELHYFAAMFINHPEVIREVAKNPHIDAKTQRVILNDSALSKDARVIRNLADNPAIGAEVMTHILGTSEDTIARHAVTRNAVRKSLQSNGSDTPYVKICDGLADSTYDPALRLIALPGVRSQDVLRKIVRTRDTVLGARELEAVADNIHAPKDLLVQMAGTSPLRQTIQAGYGVNIGQRAARTLGLLDHPELDRDALTHP